MENKNNNFQVIIIGGGPGGYVCAIRLAQLGFKVALIDKNKNLGGTCLNEGCIPSKALLSSSEYYYNAKYTLSEHGIKIDNTEIDIIKMMQRKNLVVKENTDGISFLMKKNKITVFNARAQFKNKNTIELIWENDNLKNKDDQIGFVNAEKIVIATGAVPVEIPGLPFSNVNILDSKQALNLSEVPEYLTVIGAGAIGLELGSVWSRLGSKVTIVEALPALINSFDKSAASLLQRSLSSRGIVFHFNSKAKELQNNNDRLELVIEKPNGETEKILSSKVLVAVGRKANSKSLNLEEPNIELEKSGHIKVDKSFQTSVENIYAIGDITQGAMLAHRAEEDGMALAEILSGNKADLHYQENLPFIIYTHPEIAWAGKNEATLREENIPFNTGRYFFRANGRAKAMAETEGQIKILSHKESGEILGLMMVGPYVSELIAEAVIAMKNKITVKDIANTVHAHPTLSEAFREAAMACNKESIHS